jgi:hypothetical protein
MQNSRKSIRRTHRSAKGQAIIGGTACLILLTTLFSGMLLLLLNSGILSTDNQQLHGIASEAARHIAGSKWWLGMERPEYDANAATSEAEQAVNAELATLGLPQAQNFTVTYSKGFVRQTEVTIVNVSFDVFGLKTVSGNKFPSFVKLNVSAASSDAEQATTKHALALILVLDPKTNEIKRGIRVPIYNATLGNGYPLDPGLLRAGDSVGNFPVAYMKLNCPNDGGGHERTN